MHGARQLGLNTITEFQIQLCYNATSQGDANTTQNDSATVASDDDDTLDLDIARLQRDHPVLSKIIEVSQNNPNLPDNSYCVVNGTLYHVLEPIKFDRMMS